MVESVDLCSIRASENERNMSARIQEPPVRETRKKGNPDRGISRSIRSSRRDWMFQSRPVESSVFETLEVEKCLFASQIEALAVTES